MANIPTSVNAPNPATYVTYNNALVTDIQKALFALNAQISPIVNGLITSGTLASRPAFGTADRFYYATDTKQLFYDIGTAWDLVGGIKLQTEVATTSGTFVDVTAIPANIRRLSVLLNGVSINAAASLRVQIGEVGAGLVTSGYNGSGTELAAAAVVTGNVTDGFAVTVNSPGAGASVRGCMTLELQDAVGNNWVARGTFGRSDNTFTYVSGGARGLAGLLDRIRLTTGGGTAVFDAGAMSVSWEF